LPKMKIEVLGPACNKCEYLYKYFLKICRENDIDAEVLFIERMDEILKYGIMMTPAVVIDGETKSVGRVPSKAEIRKWLGF